MPHRPDQYLIVPGVSIGPIKIGMDLDEATSILGRYNRSEQVGGYNKSSHVAMNYVWDHGGGRRFEVQTVAGTSKIEGIYIFYDPQYTTMDEKIHVGLTKAQVTAVMGQPSQIFRFQDHHTLVYNGISLAVGDSSRYRSFGVVYRIAVATRFYVTF